MKKLITAALLASLFISCSTPPEDENTNNGSGTIPENPSDSNYSFETAERITLGSTVKGNLFNSNDIDSYVFDIPHNALLRVELSMVSDEAKYSYLTLWDSDERKQQAIALVDSAIYFPIAKPGTYYLCSSGFLVLGHGPSGAGDFEFIVSLDTIDTHEFNDNIDHATPIQRNTVYQSKLLPTSTDIDYFSFTIDKPQAVKLDIDNISSRYELCASIVDEEGVLVNSYSYEDTQDDTLNIITHLDRAGTYLIGFSAIDNSGDSDKPFSFSINDYTIDDNEFNDNLKNATPIPSFPYSTKGNLAVMNDEDYFKFTITEKSTVTMGLDNISSLVEYMNIYLYREEGGHYFEHYRSEYFVSSYSRSHVFEPGAYYIALSAGHKTSEKLYDFTVTKTPVVE